jgi:DNA-binding response OmpR family regulator
MLFIRVVRWKGVRIMPTTPTVLVVDDDATIRDMLSMLLTSEGYDPEAAPDAMSGLARIEQGGVDLVLLDLKLVGVDGLELCRRVRAAEHGEHLPIIALSGTVDDHWESASRAAGADDVVAKPFDIDVLLDRVRKRLGD